MESKYRTFQLKPDAKIRFLPSPHQKAMLSDLEHYNKIPCVGHTVQYIDLDMAAVEQVFLEQRMERKIMQDKLYEDQAYLYVLREL